MELLATLVVGKPLNISGVALMFLVGHALVRRAGIGSDRHPRALLVVAAAWAVYAAWEWLILVRTPQANIRVDLILIWPLVLILSMWFTIRALK
jgi:hypothetical protein